MRSGRDKGGLEKLSSLTLHDVTAPHMSTWLHTQCIILGHTTLPVYLLFVVRAPMHIHLASCGKAIRMYIRLADPYFFSHMCLK
jgi:hypothetical protein